MKALLLAALLLAPAAAFCAEETAASVPLVYAARLSPGAAASLDAGPAFLADEPAQRWFLDNRPDLAPRVFHAALEAADQKDALLGFDDPRALRAALVARDDDDLLSRPAKLLAFIERVPALAERAALYRRACLEWDTLPEAAKEVLREEGFAAERWERATLRQRQEAVEEAYAKRLEAQATAAPADKPWSARYEERLSALDWFLTPQQLKVGRFGQRLRRAQRAEAALDRARGDAAALSEADFKAAVARADESAPALDLDEAQLHELGVKLGAAVLAELDRTAAGPRLRRLYAERAPSVRVAVLGAGFAAFTPTTKVVTFDRAGFVQVVSALGYRPADLLSDPAALRKVALFLSPTFAHEATHEAQHERPENNAAFKTYSEESEIEAFGAQAVAARQLSADPEFADSRRRVSEKQRLLLLPPARTTEEVRSWLRSTSFYADLPTARRRAATAIESERLTDILDLADGERGDALRELAYRRRHGRPSAGRLGSKPTLELRRLRDGSSGPLGAVETAMEYLRRWEAELAALSSELAASL